MVNFYGGRIKNLTSDGEISATGMNEKSDVLISAPPVEGVFAVFKLNRNDVILKVNGIEVNNVTRFKLEMEKGEVKNLTIWRNQGEIILENM